MKTELADVRTRLTRVEIGQEQQSDRIQLFSEKLGSFQEAMDRHFTEVDERFDAQEAFIRSLFHGQHEHTDALDTRVARLERGRRD